MQADTGKKFHEVAGGLVARGPEAAHHPLGGTPTLVVYRPIFVSRTVTVLDVKERKALHDLPTQEGDVVAIGVSADARTVVTVDAKGNVLAWDPGSAREVVTREVAGEVKAVAVDASGKRVAVVLDGAVRLVDLAAR